MYSPPLLSRKDEQKTPGGHRFFTLRLRDPCPFSEDPCPNQRVLRTVGFSSPSRSSPGVPGSRSAGPLQKTGLRADLCWRCSSTKGTNTAR